MGAQHLPPRGGGGTTALWSVLICRGGLLALPPGFVLFAFAFNAGQARLHLFEGRLPRGDRLHARRLRPIRSRPPTLSSASEAGSGMNSDSVCALSS